MSAGGEYKTGWVLCSTDHETKGEKEDVQDVGYDILTRVKAGEWLPATLNLVSYKNLYNGV